MPRSWVFQGLAEQWTVVRAFGANEAQRTSALAAHRARQALKNALLACTDAEDTLVRARLCDILQTLRALPSRAESVSTSELLEHVGRALTARELLLLETPSASNGALPAPPKPSPEPTPPPAPPDEPKPREVTQVTWQESEGVCGDTVHVDVTTRNYPDGEALTVALQAPGTSAPSLQGKTKSNAVSATWVLQDLAAPKQGAGYAEKVAVSASCSGKSTEKKLSVRFFPNADWETFDRSAKWNGFSNHAKFRQRLKEFVGEVEMTLDIMKAWSGSYVDLRKAGITGKAGGCPWDGYRWGRNTGLGMAPNEYHDGTKWVPLPKGFTPSASNFGATAFVESGGNYVMASGGGTWPEKFADYDFDGKPYTQTREQWIQSVHDKWSKQFPIRRKACKSKKDVRCCRYDIDVTLKLNTVKAKADGVVLCAPGALRDNAGLFHMPGSSKQVVVHEVGHHLDNPDEYKDGGIDPSQKDEDGLKSGIDENSIMGQNLSTVKKRHYHAFVEMTRKLVKKAGGKDEDYVAVDP